MIERRLRLNRQKALSYAQAASENFVRYGGRDIIVTTDANIPVGDAYVDNYNGSCSDMVIGTKGLSCFGDFALSPVNDLDFVRMFVALHHEYGHYLQVYGGIGIVETAVSEVSVIGNKPYYYSNKSQLPHEIFAEAVGVSLSWDALTDICDDVDAVMLKYVNDMADHSTYFIQSRPGGYLSRQDVESAFDAAAHASIHDPRRVEGDFLYKSDESIRLLMQDCRNRKLSPNSFHVDRLIDTIPGAQKDRMMAALVLHLHPDLLDERPLLQGQGLTVEHEFGRPLVMDTLPGRAGADKRSHTTPNFDCLQRLLSERDEASGPGIQGGVEY